MKVKSLKQGEWLCYRGGQFNGGRMVILLRWPLRGENGHVTVWPVMEGAWSCYRGGQFKRVREWSCYGGGQFNGGRMVMLQRRTV